MRPLSPAALLTLSSAGLVGYAIVARSVSRRRTAADDRKVRDEVQGARAPKGEAVAKAVDPIGKEWLHIPVAAVLSGTLYRRGAAGYAAIYESGAPAVG